MLLTNGAKPRSKEFFLSAIGRHVISSAFSSNKVGSSLPVGESICDLLDFSILLDLIKSKDYDQLRKQIIHSEYMYFMEEEQEKYVKNIIEISIKRLNELGIDDIQNSVRLTKQAYPYKSAIYFASSRGKLQMTEILLKHGAYPNAIGYRAWDTILSKAVEDSNVEMVKLLLKYGADPNFKNAGGKPYIEVDKIKNPTIKNMITNSGH